MLAGVIHILFKRKVLFNKIRCKTATLEIGYIYCSFTQFP